MLSDTRIAIDIHQFGGTVLASSRGPQDPAKMVDFLVEKNIDILFCIGMEVPILYQQDLTLVKVEMARRRELARFFVR